MLSQQAGLVEKIVSSSDHALRLEPEYFLVAFRGSGFPIYIKVRNVRE